MAEYIEKTKNKKQEKESLAGKSALIKDFQKLSYPALTKNSTTVLNRRYLRKNNKAEIIETPDDLFLRVATVIAEATKTYEGEEASLKDEKNFYKMMRNLEFMPNSPTLMNAGRTLGQLSACFVLPVEDSMSNIFEAIKNTALIHKSGGGTGFSFSHLRPKNDVVKSTKGISSGPISFMGVFDSATEAIKQGGTRRGANMGILRIDHPDIEDFILCKRDHTNLNNFNISIAVTDKFMDALEHDAYFDLINPHTGKKAKSVKAKKLYDMIVDSAWENGEPGVIFIDKINKKNPTPEVGRMESTNPCGEQPLLPFESCNLGSINLKKMVKNVNGVNIVDYEKLRETARNAVKFLDNVIDMNKYPLEQIQKTTYTNRKIGLGVMGFADLLIMLGIPYNSEKALEIASEIMSFIQNEGRKKSAELAEKRGSFPNFSKSIYKNLGYEKIRNATITTIAPTGTISIISNCSSGVEPLFALAYFRNVLDNDKLLETHPYFAHVAKERGFYSDKLFEKIAEGKSISEIAEIPDDIKKVFVTSHDITPEWHIKMQAAFQKYTDNAVSKTVNFPNKATREDVANVYQMAYHMECKGVTVYRDGSRPIQVLNKGLKGKKTEEQAEFHASKPRPRPDLTVGTTRKMKTGCGNLYITINEDENGVPFELFGQMGKAGGCAASQAEAISRLISFALRSDMKMGTIVHQLRGIRCHQTSWDKGTKILSCADAIGQSIERYLSVKEKATSDMPADPSENLRGACPECGGILEHEGGCVVCKACAYSECA